MNQKIAILVILTISICLIASIAFNFWYDANFYHYKTFYGSNRLTSAPDGFYSCLVCQLEEPDRVWFPLSPSYGGELHGVWLYDVELVNFTDNKWYRIHLIDNIIVQAEVD